MNTTTIGWIGLGNMGIPMSQQLIAAGYPVTVYNRNKEKETALKAAGAATADTPAALIGQAAVVFTMVSDDQAIEDIFLGNDGLLKAPGPGKLIINMSTVSPGSSKKMAAACEKQGCQYLDAPVSGSVKQAETGQLVIMVGGATTAFEQATPMLQHLGRLVLHVGEAGAGNTAKLAMNLLLGIYAQGLAEATLFAQTHGIETKNFLNIFNNSALGNVFGKIKGDAILQGNFKAAFALKLIAKDLRLAKAEGLDTPLGETAYQSFQRAEPDYGDQDIIAILSALEKLK